MGPFGVWGNGGLGLLELAAGQVRTARGECVCAHVHIVYVYICIPVCLGTRVPAHVLYACLRLRLWSPSLSSQASSELPSDSFTINSFTKL